MGGKSGQESVASGEPLLRKSRSHGRIGEAAVAAKCWMNGIEAFSTAGLRANFAGADLIVETPQTRRKLWVQVKSGIPILKDHVYLTQCAGESDLSQRKFDADFVIFVNIDNRAGKANRHEGTLDFRHLSFYVVPGAKANQLYLRALKHWAEKPKRDGGRRKLTNMAVHVPAPDMDQYREAWGLLKAACTRGMGED